MSCETNNEQLKVIILAAGKGTRFKSKKPKVLHEILGKPMLFYVSLAAKWTNPKEIIYIIGHEKEQVKRFIDCEGCVFVEQTQQLGTGHAVSVAKNHIENFEGLVLILNGDTPLIKGETLKNAVKYMEALIRYEGANASNFRGYRNEKVAGVVLSSRVPNPYGYGRIVKDGNHIIKKIVEEKDANPEEKMINEVNSGIYIFYAPYLVKALDKIENNNAQGEYYLTDIVEILRKEGKDIYALEIPDYTEILGVNDRWELAKAENVLKVQFMHFWALNGVTFHNPESIWIEFDVDFSKDVEIFQNTILQGKTEIGEGSVIGANCIIKNSKIGKNVQILPNTIIEDSIIEDNAVIGPFARLRNNTVIKEGVNIGNFVEVKSSTIGEKTNAKHLAYIGDAQIGKNVNIGAGTITCNYDGYKKHKTVIEDNAFIGSDTMLVAPIVIGKGAITGSGSVITKNVPENALAIERTQMKIIEGYREKLEKKHNKEEKH